MSPDISISTQPYNRQTPFSSLEMGHATTSSYHNDAASSAYLIFSTQAALSNSRASAVQDAWVSVIADGADDQLTCNVASQVSAESIYYCLSNTSASFAEMPRQLDTAFQQTNQELLKITQQENSNTPFRSSLLAAVVLNGCFFLASVGNCQAYLFRNDSVHRLTYESVRQRTLKSRSALFPPKPLATRTALEQPKFMGERSKLSVRHISFAVKGEPPSAEKATARRLANHLTLEPEDVIVLCSDEIATLIGQSKIETLATLLPPQEAAEEIIQLTAELQANVACSTIVMRWNGDRQPAETYSEQRRFLR